jgi:hypothetical protein
MSALRTSYEFTLPRGYVDAAGTVHRKGTMRLATARDELEPLRDPAVAGPDDPRLTILVLSRVVETLGDLERVNSPVIEGLFAVDLAYLQDFYGVINFGSQAEYDELVRSQRETTLVGGAPPVQTQPEPEPLSSPDTSDAGGSEGPRVPLRAAVEELPRQAL